MKDRNNRGPSVGLVPMPGLYKTRLGKGCPWVPARIDVTPSHDPETGEILDRPPMLRCLVAGEYVDPLEVWPMWPVERTEYLRLMDEMPDDPRAPK